METFAVDANPLISSLLGGRSRTVLFSGAFTFITTERTTWEVKKYMPKISVQTALAESELIKNFERIPIVAKQTSEYDAKRNQAEDLIARRDPKDVDILALALKFNVPIWTNDDDFKGLTELQIFTTADMFEKLAARML